MYFAGVVTGSLATSIADPTSYLAGASGGVYAIMTAHIATIIMVIILLYDYKRSFLVQNALSWRHYMLF